MAKDTYVLVHGAWHTGELLEPVAQHLRKRGHTVYCPTLAGNRPGDDRSKTGLADAARSLTEFVTGHGLTDVRLMGHSYGGMVISQAYAALADRVKRLVYWNAFVPLNGQCLNDMIPPQYIGLFEQIAAASEGAISLPYPIWREAFITTSGPVAVRYPQVITHFDNGKLDVAHLTGETSHSQSLANCSRFALRSVGAHIPISRGVARLTETRLQINRVHQAQRFFVGQKRLLHLIHHIGE